MKKYTVVSTNNVATLIKAVNELIEKGWQPLGAPFSDSDEETTRLCQALILEE